MSNGDQIMTVLQRLLPFIAAGRATAHLVIVVIQSAKTATSPMTVFKSAVALASKFSPGKLEVRYRDSRIGGVDPRSAGQRKATKRSSNRHLIVHRSIAWLGTMHEL